MAGQLDAALAKLKVSWVFLKAKSLMPKYSVVLHCWVAFSLLIQALLLCLCGSVNDKSHSEALHISIPRARLQKIYAFCLLDDIQDIIL